ISRFTRPRPEAATVAPVTEAEEAPAASENADISRFTRPRPEAATVAPVTEAEEAPAASENADITRFTRPRPGTVAEDEVGAPEAELTEEERLKAILPGIVTTMGDNRENSYVVDYLEQDPYLVNIYEGYGFAKDYGSARGHEYTLEDVAKTQRPHPKANCITCKTPDLHKMIEEQGVAVYSMPFDEVFPQMTNNVSCYTCHGDDMGNGGALKVTHQYVNEALGENVSTINPATLSCGQCHIEYYFTPADSETMMPYHSVEEMTPEAILAYYDDMGFADWTQESTGTAMLKAQHPEMETFLQGKHAAFLSCADCHMPTETTDAGVAFRSHMLVSPLENEALLASCAQCHGDTDMTAFVKDIQQKVTARETEVGNRLSAMKDALAAAVASGAWSEDDLNAVRKLHREAQWFFDFCYVENSEGAHNSELSMHCLDTADAKIDEAMALLEKATT
ncbi:MAG: ammonia-forming cytochrome c nitrite reductase subunit c552, partial [Clostridia bacterium]|nr:ammonia-forming cytochrome c nitrite reductase subunit c552 [Clostridia bacterium]